ncbi:MAG: CoB--CoM heterodisulfide reductase iron-sulfur subunit A family protein [Promethearchaeota archaeon]|nr:MAG: CoB--CoM heterodisulfide reductase iron-sulfur subunit A family protein [Candidatus Lokiarchaeota archaeon]
MKKINKNIKKTICIFGGGILGLNISIQLADLGFKIFLIDNKPFFGGNAAHLYKAFPTNDCFFCLLSTSYKAGIRKCFYRSGINFHPNITLLRNTELLSLNGNKGNFELELKNNPTYVNNNCINCGKCIDICPKVEDIKDTRNIESNSPIVSYNYPQCISNYYSIRRTKCDPDCKKCEEVCPVNAINLNEKEERVQISCSNIVVSSGFQEFDPSEIKNYKYGELEDVITQDQLALMLDPDGPTNGKLIRPSNHKPVETVVMLQCVGSRDEKYNKYCSELCCNYAIKHANIIKDNIKPSPDVYIIYIDIRTMGFLENYYSSARENDIQFIKGNLTDVEISQDNKSKDNKLKLKVYDAILNAILMISSDLLVLSTGIIPSKPGINLCKKIELQLNDEGFVDVDEDSISTNKSGIYACGSLTRPTDLSHSSTISKNIVLKIYKDFLIKEEINNY